MSLICRDEHETIVWCGEVVGVRVGREVLQAMWGVSICGVCDVERLADG